MGIKNTPALFNVYFEDIVIYPNTLEGCTEYNRIDWFTYVENPGAILV